MRKKHRPTILSVLFLAVVWELIARQIGFPAIFPTLGGLLKETGKLIISPDFFVEIGYTVSRGLIGFALALALGFILASVASFSSFWDAFFHPLVVVSRSIPVISLVLVALLWFAPPQLPVFIALITMFPLLYQNILTGLKQTDPRYLEMAIVFGKSKSSQFFHIALPAAKNVIYDGMKSAMGFGWRAIIIGEVLAQPLHGIGTSMKQAQAYINVSELVAWTVVAIGISYLFELLIKQVQQLSVNRHLPAALEFDHKISIPQGGIERIKVIDLAKEFNGQIILESFSKVFHAGKVNCLKGPSGKGKTTLLRMLAQLEKPDEGEVQIPANVRYGYAFQDMRLLPWLTVTGNISFVLESTGLHKHEISNLVAYLLEKMELSEHAHKYPHELSGGQQQRVALARALAVQPDILLLDEPLTGLDNELKKRIIAFLSEWFEATHPLVIWATHENIRMENIETEEIFI